MHVNGRLADSEWAEDMHLYVGMHACLSFIGGLDEHQNLLKCMFAHTQDVLLIHIPSGGLTHICHSAMRWLAAHCILNDATQSVKAQTYNSLGQAEAHTHVLDGAWSCSSGPGMQATLHTDLTGVALTTTNSIFHHFSSKSLYPHHLRLTLLLDKHLRTSLSTSPLRNSCRHFEVRSTSSSGCGNRAVSRSLR